jgi:hypothetical protein
VPNVVQMPQEMWKEILSVATRCWSASCASGKGLGAEVFAELGTLLGCTPLGPRNDPDVASAQLMKDIKRETVQVNEETFAGASGFDALYNALESIVLSHSPGLEGLALEHKVQRLLRGCSRTVSGYDAYDVVSAVMAGAGQPKALVTPAMMSNSPIRIEHRKGAPLLTVSSVNVFKVSRELEDGSLATVVVFKTEVTEQFDLATWSTVRWISLKPLDAAEECANPMVLFRDRTLVALMERAAQADKAQRLAFFDLCAETKQHLDLAIEQTVRAIKNFAESEYTRGFEDALARRADVVEPKRGGTATAAATATAESSKRGAAVPLASAVAAPSVSPAAKGVQNVKNFFVGNFST